MKKILVGLSGGVDSAVTAYLLQKQGYDITAGFMINYLADNGNCPTKQDIQEAKKVANFLGINFFSFDYQKEYWDKIVEYIFEGYKHGYTPNPDILCNTEIKFKLFLEEALNLGFDGIATGHYANIVESNKNETKSRPGLKKLLKGKDPVKDQSYFLAGLEQWQLSKALFPIGNMEKNEVRQIAKEIGLPNADRKDSQGLCFIGKVDMKSFLRQKLPIRKGKIIDTGGNILGEHDGAWFFTIGQRRGIGVSGPNPLYIVDKDVDNNTITVGEEKDLNLFSKELTTASRHWLSEKLDFPQTGYGRIRHGQELQKCEIFDFGDGKVKAVFENKQRAIASGQTFAFYQGEELVGSGVIA
ncbi:tRNA 2-thiouridine(34) synthase MnmA [Candidatus Absconditicoccus praedator]|uniref:tRNA 2-thiouridine(34) synthase MnmA n=1 Tax=Candidatus Absconditicoccus praedator TaxID=2735562 RepID=UPI001E298E7C|nr:tRNA 2-thiouridine(34) synthase MnmA [Candidatus Absconditicoccus praedator]UFX82944.1 tRNA 2-thiouridine(34) synthase MnmA [Candidatus Absconditicoccus praedator]